MKIISTIPKANITDFMDFYPDGKLQVLLTTDYIHAPLIDGLETALLLQENDLKWVRNVNKAYFGRHYATILCDSVRIAVYLENQGNTVALWKNGKVELAIFQRYCKEVAFHHEKRRGRVLKGVSFYGFRNIQEIKRSKPKYLITDMPIRSAIFGIDLAKRQRRPSKYYTGNLTDIVLTKRELDLARRNYETLFRAVEK